ncbi:Hint domain-containing protein [Psychromarinibacter sediminicola]|uniref:Hint domain-containing protein n=1 Tax=Psychromarinibacter sediminicola TaxID=3033385 RepID=UPI0028685B23|nr:Hint domain-containing protein [Psychromarinibacter sediminicola]
MTMVKYERDWTAIQDGDGVPAPVGAPVRPGRQEGRQETADSAATTPCFTPGTQIATARGAVAVEDLAPGDRVVTRDNGLQEVRWVGAKRMSGRDLLRRPHLRPVLIRQGALGNGQPAQDMLLSPNHRVLVASDQTQLYFEEREVLCSAKHLINNRGIQAVQTTGTTYVHFMFDRHEVVLSDGAWSESFQPGDHSLRGIGAAQRQEILELFPELRGKPGLEGFLAARRVLTRTEARRLQE